MQILIVLVGFIGLLLQVLAFAIIARAVLSWFGPGFDNPLTRALYEVTEPILRPLRRVVPRLGMVDLTPAVALLLIAFLEQVLPSLLRYGHG